LTTKKENVMAKRSNVPAANLESLEQVHPPAGLLNYSRYLMGKRVSIYGPNFIWTGKFVGESDDAIVLEHVSQIYDTNSHAECEPDLEWITDVMIYPKCAICNIGTSRWAQKVPEVPAQKDGK
jgi:hypothetical protein